MITIAEGRYDRQERISWWDQERLSNARVFVIGAGALGNEIVKNLALVGVGHIDVVDMDEIEHSNLARCALFRDEDEGRPKAVALAEAAVRLNPGVTTRAFVCPVQQLGSAWLLQYDMVIAGLDSREARLWVNGACRRIGRPWIDGAIEGLQGIVRMFGVDGPCYDCTLGESERLAISHRRSCALLSPDEILSGKTPTNATTASVVAALEVQEAIKWIVGRDDLLALLGRVWRLDGETMMTSVVEYVEDPDCISHDAVDEWVEPPAEFRHLLDVVQHVERASGGAVSAIYFPDDVIHVRPCGECGIGESIIGLRPMIESGAGRCADCGAERPIDSRTALSLDDDLVALPWREWRWPRIEAIAVNLESEFVHIPLEGRS